MTNCGNSGGGSNTVAGISPRPIPEEKKTMLDLGHNKNLIKGYIHAKDYFGYHQLAFLSKELLNLFILNRYLPNTFSHRIQKLLSYAFSISMKLIKDKTKNKK